MYDKLSKRDIERMEEEIEHRKLIVRKEALEAVKEARSHGDLSENFEYHAAKADKNKNESRIRYLERMIKTARIIEDETTDNQVGLNDTVTILFVEEKEEVKYKIVTTVREDALHGRISMESPVGKALMGHGKGETVTVYVNDKVSYPIQIIEIDKGQGEEDDRIRKF